MEAPANPSAHEQWYGNYRLAPDHSVAINRFIMDSGDDVLLFADHKSGVVRRLFPVSETEYSMGPGFNTASPAELSIRLDKDANGAVRGILLQPTGADAAFAERVPLKEEEVVIDANGKAKLAGTLTLPTTSGHHSSAWLGSSDALFLRALPAFLRVARLRRTLL